MVRSEKLTGQFTQDRYDEVMNRLDYIIENCPAKLYSSELLCNDRHCKSRAEYEFKTIPLMELIADRVDENMLTRVLSIDSATYNDGKRKSKIETLIIDNPMRYIEEPINGMRTSKENRMVHVLLKQKQIGSYSALDFQIPTENGESNKIDLLLKDISGNIYLTEVKELGSNENLLRCILEIETYYRKLNSKFAKKYIEQDFNNASVKKAILVDKTSWAFQQYINKTIYPKTMALMQKLGILLLELEYVESKKQFSIK